MLEKFNCAQNEQGRSKFPVNLAGTQKRKRKAPFHPQFPRSSDFSIAIDPRRRRKPCRRISGSGGARWVRSSLREDTAQMQIQLKCSCGDGSCPEWAIVELQGVVEVQPSFQGQLQNLEIGKLCRPSSQEVYTFTVGYHELTGSKVPLKKPFLVLKKVKLMDAEQSSNTDSANSPKVELEVVGIIRHRILFKTRPKALISRPEPVVKATAHASGSIASNSSQWYEQGCWRTWSWYFIKKRTFQANCGNNSMLPLVYLICFWQKLPKSFWMWKLWNLSNDERMPFYLYLCLCKRST